MDNLDLAAEAAEQLFRLNRAQFKPDLQFAEFMALVEIPDDDGECWIWRGPRSGAQGIFHDVIATHFILSHVGYERPGGGLDNYQVAVLCSTPLCVNPEHLQWQTHREIIKHAVRVKAAQDERV